MENNMEISQKLKQSYHMTQQSNYWAYTLLLLLLLLLLLSRFSRVRLCATPQTAAHQAPPSLGFSRQEHWSGLPFPSPVHEETIIQNDTCIPMLTAALFTPARTWKQPKYPSTDERIKKLWDIYTHTVEYYSAIKRNEIGSFAVMWMNQSLSYKWTTKEKNKYHILTRACIYIWNLPWWLSP